MDSVEVKTNVNCPGKETLVQLMEGTLDDVEQIEAHLQACNLCQQKLDSLSQSDVLSQFLPNGKYHTKPTKIHFLTNPERHGDLGTINEFLIEEEIGRGGAGVVFRGFDPKLSRSVAIKVLHNDGNFRSDARFERESKVAARVRNDHIVSVHAVGNTHDGRPYIVMPLITGRSLKELLNAELAEQNRTATTIAQIATGLHALHLAGIIHRDVKPANILIDDEDGRAKLTDFGLARETMADETLTQLGVLCGTPEYMSPEQASGNEVGPQSDIYSLGITLYECLTGTTPFRGKPLNILRQHCESSSATPSQVNPKVARDLETICLRAIAKEPRKRYQSSLEMAADLNRFLAGKPILARSTPVWEKVYLWSRRNPMTATLSALTIALLVTLAVGASLSAWNLAKANTRILAEKQLATDARQRADQDRAAAVNALNDLVESLYDDLSDNSATIEAREKLVAAAMNGLKSVTRIEEDEIGDKTQYLALMRMADLATLQGDDELSNEIFNQVIGLARQKVTQNPDDENWAINLAKSLGEFGVATRNHDIELSDKLNAESMEILTAILDRDPTNFQVKNLLLVEKCARLELIRFRSIASPQPVIEYGIKVLSEIDRTIENLSTNHSVAKTAYTINFVLGRAYLESGDNHKALQFFRDARVHIESALKVKPNNFYLKSAIGTLDRALSMSAGALGQMEDSLNSFNSSVAQFRHLSNANPDDLRMKLQLAGTLSLGSQSLLFCGQGANALNATAEAEKIYLQLIEATPNNDAHKILLTENWMRRIYLLLCLGQFDEAFELSNQTIKHLNSIKNPTVASSVMHQTIAANKYKQVTGWLVNMPPESPTLFDKINAVLFSLRPVVISMQDFDLKDSPVIPLIARIDPEFTGTRIPDVFDWLDQMSDRQTAFDDQITAIELGVFGLIGRNCSDQSDPDLQSRANQCLDHCMDLLRQNPLQAGAVMGQPDLDWLRSTEEFKSYLPNLQTAWQASN